MIESAPPMQDLPLVSIVTPTYNTARYLRETIDSVLAQDYPRIQYLVMDGGSSDGTLELLAEYEGRLEWESAQDGGAADAIAKGFQRCGGTILAYLNADDTYFPGAVSAAVARFQDEPDAVVVYGDGYWIDASGGNLGPYPTRPYSADLLRQECFVCQPAAFFEREAFLRAGGIDPQIRFSFDYDLWIRMARQGRFSKLDRFLASSRMHHQNKTLGSRREVLSETIDLLSSHYQYVPYRWAAEIVSHREDPRDGFFEKSAFSFKTYFLTLVWGVSRNGRHPFRFIKEWMRAMRPLGVVRTSRAFSSGSR